jgi:PTH1 family peptidyl-tRNA hydrolase
MKFVFGLGNPGEKYATTRHNAGFLVVEEVARLLSANAATGWKNASKFSAEILQIDDVFLAKPQTFMNDSGRAVRAAMEYYEKSIRFADGEKIDNLFVIYDDLDLEVGSYKIQFATGPKVHNGLSSVLQHIHTDQFWHVRVGVDGRKGSRDLPGQAYVLLPFVGEEKILFEKTIKDIAEEVVRRLKHSSPNAAVKKRLKGDLAPMQDLFTGYQLQDKGGYITQEFQDFGYRLAMALDDKEHTSIYMRLAKKEPRVLLEQVLSFVSDAKDVKNKAALFLWKLKDAKQKNAETKKS